LFDFFCGQSKKAILLFSDYVARKIEKKVIPTTFGYPVNKTLALVQFTFSGAI
jgi:hypothetical protein